MPRFRTNSPSPGWPTLSTKAFSLLEIVSVIAIIGILGGTIVPLAVQQLTSKRGEVTVDRLEEFKKAIIGNPFVIGDDVRSSFGYLGDMGSLPPQMPDGKMPEDLYKNPFTNPSSLLYGAKASPYYTYDSNKKTGAGWRGPYINPDIIEDLATLRLDAYMQQLVYSTTPFTDATQTNASVVGSLTSTGPNRTQGGGVADDRKVYIFQSEARATVSGFVKDTQGNRLGGVSVTINYPSNGTLTTSLPYVTAADGYFTFPNIPYGNRSITVVPKIVYAPGSYKVGDFYDSAPGPQPLPPESPPDGIPDDVILYVTNRSSADITIKGIVVYFDIAAKGGPPNYEDLVFAGVKAQVIGGGQSGVLAKLDATTIGGSGNPSAQNYVVRVQSPQTHLPDLRIGDYPVGGTARLVITGFKSGGNFLNMSGVQLKVEFYENYSGSSGTPPPISTIYFP